MSYEKEDLLFEPIGYLNTLQKAPKLLDEATDSIAMVLAATDSINQWLNEDQKAQARYKKWYNKKHAMDL